jgi:hypothetical protein
MIGLLPFSLKYLLSKIFISEMQSDTRGWLGKAYEHVASGGPLQRLRIINN